MVKHMITAAMKQLEIRPISMDSLMVACLLRVTQEMYVNQLWIQDQKLISILNERQLNGS